MNLLSKSLSFLGLALTLGFSANAMACPCQDAKQADAKAPCACPDGKCNCDKGKACSKADGKCGCDKDKADCTCPDGKCDCDNAQADAKADDKNTEPKADAKADDKTAHHPENKADHH